MLRISFGVQIDSIDSISVPALSLYHATKKKGLQVQALQRDHCLSSIAY